MHLNEGQLRAYLDQELATPALEEARVHLEACPQCQARLAETQHRKDLAGGKLAFLAPQPGDTAPRLMDKAAWARFRSRLDEHKEKPMLNHLFTPRLRPVWITVLVVAILGITLSIPQGRAWAGQFLGLFRVQQVTVLPIDPSGLTALTGNDALGKQISQLLASSVDVQQKPGEPVTAADAAEASQKADFNVRLPADAPANPSITVQPGSAYTIKVDRKRAQALLDESGHKDLVLPESLDGANIEINIPSGITAAYGACPQPISDTAALPSSNSVGNDPDVNSFSLGSMSRRFPDCVMLAEIPSPIVNTPPDIDLKQLAVIGLEFTGMSPQDAQSFANSIDWTTSLVIPLPKNAATYQEVQVDGVKGQLIQRPADDAPQYALVWVKDGVIYAIAGLGSDTSKALAMANSMR